MHFKSSTLSIVIPVNDWGKNEGSIENNLVLKCWRVATMK